MKFSWQWAKRVCVGLAGMSLVSIVPLSASASVADVVYYGGMIYTFTEDFSKPLDPYHAQTVELVAVKDGKIVFAGEMDQAQRSGYLDAERVGCFANLNGRTMLPGFVAAGATGQKDATVFASAGITTLEQYGVELADVLPVWQQAVSPQGTWPLRVILHPEGGGEQGARNRAFLGWPDGREIADGRGGHDTAKSMPSDATAQASFPQPERTGGTKPSQLASGADISNFHRTEKLFPLKSHLLFLGAWRLVLDTPSAVPDSLWRKAQKAESARKPQYFDELTALYHSHGQTLAIQAAGDGAMEAAVTALENAVLASPLDDARHSIFPASMTERQHVARLAGRYDSLEGDLVDVLELDDEVKKSLLARNWSDAQWQALASKMRSQRAVLTYDMAAVAEWGEQGQGWTALGSGVGANLTPTGWSVAYEMPVGLQGFAPSMTPTKPAPKSPANASAKPGKSSVSAKSADKAATTPTPTVTPKASAVTDSWTPLVQVQAAVLRLPRTVTEPASSPGSFVSPKATPLSEGQVETPQEVNGTQQDLNATFRADQPDGVEEYWQYDQRVSVLQALHGVTTVPAFRNHLDHLLGTIEVGKLADFVILNRNPMEIAFTEPLALEDITVYATIVGGKVVFGSLDCTQKTPREVLTGDESLAVGIRAR